MGKALNYKQCIKFAFWLKMIVALSFVPDIFILKEYQDILDYFLNSNVDSCLIDVLFWFEKNFLKILVYKSTYDCETPYTIFRHILMF
jgi:hypothetical protein